MTIEYLWDDKATVKTFIAKLPKYLVDQRFSRDALTGKLSTWTPDRTVLAMRDGVPVALADCVIGDDKISANASLLAAPNFGGYAICAFLTMKKTLNFEYWESTLNDPSPSTIAISARYFDATFDGIAWEMSQHFIKILGPIPQLTPHTIIVSKKRLTKYGLPSLNSFDPSTVEQIHFVANNPLRHTLICPTGTRLDPGTFFALTCEMSNVSMKVRQESSRGFVLLIATSLGIKIPFEIAKLTEAKSGMPIFLSQIKKFSNAQKNTTGLFKIVTV
jgi:hypothetical protein